MPFEDLESMLDLAKWQKLDVADKKDFHEYQVMRQHKKVDETTVRYLIQMPDDADPRSVDLQFAVKGKDPLKDVGTAELKILDKYIVGIDLEGDCYQRK